MLRPLCTLSLKYFWSLMARYGLALHGVKGQVLQDLLNHRDILGEVLEKMPHLTPLFQGLLTDDWPYGRWLSIGSLQ